MARLVVWLADEGVIDGRAAKAAAGVCRRAADQLPRAMVLGTLLDRQADYCFLSMPILFDGLTPTLRDMVLTPSQGMV